MTYYRYEPQYKPNSEWIRKGTQWVSWDNAFTDEELETIKIANNTNRNITKHVDVTTGDGATRKTDKYVYPKNLESFDFVRHRFKKIIDIVNSQYFRFMLGETMHFRSIVYSQPGDHLEWHMDNLNWVNWDQSEGEDKEYDTSTIFEPRKLTAVIQLSDPDEYSGCDVEVMTDGGIHTAEKKKGLINIWPGYMVHRVTPLISGRRETLGVYVTGPRFK